MSPGRKRKAKRLYKRRLDRLVEEAVVDAYDESEQVTDDPGEPCAAV